MEKRYFLVGYILSKAGDALMAGNTTVACYQYPSRKALEASLLEGRVATTITIVSISEQTDEEQKAFLAE